MGGAIWTSFLLAGLLAAFTATAYAELVTRYPQAAGAVEHDHWRAPTILPVPGASRPVWR